MANICPRDGLPRGVSFSTGTIGGNTTPLIMDWDADTFVDWVVQVRA